MPTRNPKTPIERANPNLLPKSAGRPRTKLLSEALRQKLAEIELNQDRTGAEALAEKLIESALKAKPGQSTSAIGEIADRTEGKPVQSVHMTAGIDEATAKIIAELAEKLL